MARRGVTRQAVPARHSVARPFRYLFVNEGNETGNLIFGLCFPMASLDMDGPHLETGESENGEGQAGHREGQGCGELGARTLWLGRLAGSASKVPRHVTTATLCCFGNFMKKEGEKRDSWGRDSWRILLSRSVAADKLGATGCGLVELGGGRERK